MPEVPAWRKTSPPWTFNPVARLEVFKIGLQSDISQGEYKANL